MKNRKIYFYQIVILIVTILCISMFASCGEKPGDVSDIVITNSNQPRLTYVQGQELDLSKGSITVLLGTKETLVPLSAEGVTVSGYNKDQLGKQTITVTYQDKTATFEVTVVERMTLDGIEKDYFVNDLFNTSKGKLKIMKDDGSSTSVNINNASVTISELDSSTPGEKTLTAKYTVDENTSYETSFKVNVYGIGEVILKNPDKIAYSSHETDFSISGGYLTVTAEGNSSLKKMVDLTLDMISGFDPTLATSEHKTNPLIQTITVTYGSKTCSFDITVQYSSISLILDAAKLLDGINWAAMEVPAEAGNAAMEAMTEYFNLTPAKKALIKYEVSSALARAATLHTMSLFADENIKLTNTFVLSNDSQFILVPTANHEQVKEAAKVLKDNNSNFNRYAALLRSLRDEFSNVSLSDNLDNFVDDYVVAPTEEQTLLFAKVFDYLLELNDAIKTIPDDWTVETLGNYANEVTAATTLITNSGLFGPDYNHIYLLVENWRTNKDIFEIIYSYYAYVAENGHTTISGNIWQKVPLPGEMRTWYAYFYQATYEAQRLYYEGSGKAYLADTTAFMYYYYESYELANEIATGDDALLRDLYTIINCNKYMDQNLKKAPAGYISLMGIMLSSDNFLDVWSRYLELVDLQTKGELSFDTHSELFDGLLSALTKLSPTETYCFINSLHFLYSDAGGLIYMFDISQGKANSNLIALLVNYLANNFPSDYAAWQPQLFVAMESYSIYIFLNEETALEKFQSTMAMLSNVYNTLDAQQKSKFDEIVGPLYNKYLALYNMSLHHSSINMGEWKDTVAELIKTSESFFDVANYIANSETSSEDKTNALVLLIGLYQKAESLYGKLQSSGNPDVITALSTNIYSVDNTAASLDTAFFAVRSAYMNYMLSVSMSGTDSTGAPTAILLWEMYDGSGLDDFMAKAAEILVSRFENTSTNLDTVLAAMEAFANLTPESKYAFHVIGANYYYDSLNTFFHNAIANELTKVYGDQQIPADSANALVSLATEILNAETAYTALVCDPENSEKLEAFIEKMEAVIELYNSISEKDAPVRDSVLGALYSYYFSVYTAVTAK